MMNYILVDKVAVLEPDQSKWLEWFRKDNKRVTYSKIFKSPNSRPVKVSTVFLGIDHSHCHFVARKRVPMLFETMIFGGSLDQELERCSTWEEAEKMHEEMCERVKNNE